MEILKTRNDLLDTLPKNLYIVELGVFRGEFSEEIYNRTSPNKLTLVDLWQGSMVCGDKDGNNIVREENMEDVYNQIKERWKDNNNVNVVRNNTQDFLNLCEDDTYDAIYVDADHTYFSVYNDLRLSFNKLKNNGILMGHDYSPNFYQVVHAVNDFCQNYNQKITMLTEDRCPTFLIKINKNK
jgi:hypothetical protein